MNHQENENNGMMSDAQGATETKDLGYVAQVVGGTLLLGAILISGTVYYSSQLVLNHLNNGVLAAAQQAAPTAPSAPGAPSAPTPTGPVNITLKSNTPYLGNGSAKVTVVEYADYQCPFCERFFTNTWPELKAKYVDTGKIKFVYQDFAFLGADSNTLAEGSHCAADQNKFWQYHDYIFSHQGQENSGWATADKLKVMVKNIAGLNSSQFNSCLDSHKYTKEVQDETAAGKTYGVTGTPTLFVNGIAVVGAQPAATFAQAIEDALKK